MQYVVHSIESAPEASKETLSGARKAYGFLPNLLAVMAESPAMVTAYTTVAGIFDQTSLDAAERQVVLLAASSENACEYCVAAHSVIAAMQKVPEETIGAIRDGRAIADDRLEALRRFTAKVVASRGRPTPSECAAFLAAGYTKAQILEVVLGVGMKTLSNYTNHIVHTPLDQAFAKAMWSKAA